TENRAPKPTETMERIKEIAGNFWVQVAAFCFLTVFSVFLRILFLPVTPDLVISPFFSLIDIRINVYILLPAFVFIGFFLSIKPFLRFPTAGKVMFLASFFVLLTVAVNSADGGLHEIYFRALGEYRTDALKLYEHGNFLRDYHLNVKGLRGHTTVHPPGTFVYLYPFIKLLGPNWRLIAVVNALIASAGAVLTWKSAEEIYGRETADFAAMLYIAAPSLILYGSGFDAVYCFIGTLILYFSALLLNRRMPVYAVLTGVALAIGFFFSYQLVFLALLIIVWSVVYLVKKPKNGDKKRDTFESDSNTSYSTNNRLKTVTLSETFANVSITFATSALFFIFLYLAFGYDVITVFRHQLRTAEKWFSAGWNVLYWIKLTFFKARPYVGEHRSYIEWVAGNLIAFGFLLGPPTVVLFIKNQFRKTRTGRKPDGGYIFISAVTVSFVLYNLSGMTLGETERVWNFMIPLFVIGAGFQLRENTRLLYPVLIVNLVISWLFEVFFWHVN
ncbi:MAG: glycosyltransferase family 39 protein, partial [Candidatus Coatesbacteria bacterium]